MNDNFTYPKQNHEVFPYSSLNCVGLRIYYVSDAENFDTFRNFLKESTTVELTEMQWKCLSWDTIHMSNTTKNTTIHVSKGYFSIRFVGDEYVCFEKSLKELVDTLGNYLEEINATVMRIVFTKSNVWPGEEVTPEFKTALLSSDMLRIAETEYVHQKSAIYMNDVPDTNFRVFGSHAYQYYEDDEDKKYRHRYYLDNIATIRNPIAADEFVKTVEDMNQLLFDAFVWSVRADCIRAMQGKTVLSKSEEK